jgi:hypothetical protein
MIVPGEMRKQKISCSPIGVINGIKGFDRTLNLKPLG